MLEDLDGAEDMLAVSEEIVPIHLGHLLMRKAARTLRAGLVSSDAGLSRVTAIVVPGLTETCAAAVSRLVLVGRGGLRLHEEVFVTGIRLHGNKLAEGKDERLLDSALEPEALALADLDVREHLAALWRADGGRLRSRLETATEHRAERQQEAVARDLDGRRRADVARAHEIFTAFRRNLRETLAHLEEAQTELGLSCPYGATTSDASTPVISPRCVSAWTPWTRRRRVRPRVSRNGTATCGITSPAWLSSSP